MKFSMNGFRRNLSEEIKTLRDLVQSVINDDHYDAGDLEETMNSVICASNALNCVYTADDPDFTDMGHVEVALVNEEQEQAA